MDSEFEPNPLPHISIRDVLQTLGFLIVHVPWKIASTCLKNVRLRLKGACPPPLVVDVVKSLIRSSIVQIPRALQRRLSPRNAAPAKYSIRYGHIPHICQYIRTSGFVGYWICRGISLEEIHPRDSDLVVLYIHGGAYVQNHALDNATELLLIADILSTKGIIVSILSLEYTLAPAACLPKQIEEALAAYQYLVGDLGVDASKITIFGESAGGHLALSLLMRLSQPHEHTGSAILPPKPSSLFLLSPWIDLYVSGPRVGELESWDFLSRKSLLGATSLVLPSLPMDKDSALICTNFADPQSFRGTWDSVLPATTWVSAHSHELFVDEITEFVAHARNDGCLVIYDVKPSDPWGGHVWQSIEAIPQRRKLLSRDPGLPIDDLMKGYRRIADVMAELLGKSGDISGLDISDAGKRGP